MVMVVGDPLCWLYFKMAREQRKSRRCDEELPRQDVQDSKIKPAKRKVDPFGFLHWDLFWILVFEI
jgi:hypothetical protein